MDLLPLRFMLELQLGRCEHVFKDALTITGHRARERRYHLLEGALSDAWQAYCSFVRQLVIRSCTGCSTASGLVYAASIVPAQWQRASYIAIRAKQGRSIQPGHANNFLWKEPTWGDTNSIVDIVSALNPGNAHTLIAHLAGGLTGPKHCQTVRNACAHRNYQTKSEVSYLAAAYIATRIRHPTDAMTWRVPTSLEFAFLSWLDDMKTIAEGAVT